MSFKNNNLVLFLKLILKIKPNINIKYNVDMKNMNTFHLSGKCSILLELYDVSELQFTIFSLNQYQIKYFIIGNGSNVLISNNNYYDVFISLKKFMTQMIVDNNKILVQAGTKLSLICNKALKYSLSGIEFAYGIPGTIGGAIYMNAGAFNYDMKSIIIYVKYIDENGRLNIINNEDFGYRYSYFQKNKNLIIIETLLKFKFKNKNFIIENMKKNLNFRKEQHPLNLPNAGSIFKRINFDSNIIFPAKLIEKSGLKGFTIGDAQISIKHSGFIVNKGNAQYEDIISLIKYIKKIIFKNYKIKLECEINII